MQGIHDSKQGLFALVSAWRRCFYSALATAMWATKRERIPVGT